MTRAFQLNYYDHKTVQHNRANDIYYQYRIKASLDGKDWFLVVDKSDADRDTPHDYIQLRPALQARSCASRTCTCPLVQLLHERGQGVWNGHAPCPTRKKLQVKRDKADRRNAMIAWSASGSL